MTAMTLSADPDAINLAMKMAKSRARRHPSLADEFESAALVGLVEAETTFDESYGVPFIKHAAQRITGALLDCERHWTPKGYQRRWQREEHGNIPLVGSLSHQFTSVFEDGDGVNLSDSLATDGESVGAGIEYQDEIEGLARRLPRRCGDVLRRLYGRADNVTMKATADALDLSESRVSQLHSQAIDLLREGMMSRRNGTLDLDGLKPGTSRLTVGDLPVVTIGGYDDAKQTAEAKTPSPSPNGDCPQCGNPFGKRRRCFICKPSAPPFSKSPRAAGESVPPVVGPKPRPVEVPPLPAPAQSQASTPSNLMAELDAMKAIVAALDRLDGKAAARVLAWVNGRMGGRG